MSVRFMVSRSFCPLQLSICAPKGPTAFPTCACPPPIPTLALASMNTIGVTRLDCAFKTCSAQLSNSSTAVRSGPTCGLGS
eukprot:4448783-Heterocapsa_arctica.AAC.1